MKIVLLLCSLLLVLPRTQGQAQAVTTCQANSQYLESWTQQIANMSRYVWRFPSIAVSPNGEMLAVVSRASIAIYDSQTLSLLIELESNREDTEHFHDSSVSWSPDNARLAVARYFSLADPDELDPRSGVQIWNVQEQELEYMLPYVAKMAVWSPDGRVIVIAHQYGAISALDPNGHRLLVLADIGFGFDALAWSPDSQQMALSIRRGDPLILLEIGRSQIETIEIPEMDGGYLSWSPDGTNLALGSWVASEISIWNENSREVTRTLNGSDGNPFEIQWSPDGTLLARDTQNGLFLWDMTSESTSPIRAFDENVPPFVRIAWLPDSQHLISVDFEGSIYRWDIETGCVEAALLNEANTG